MTWAEAPWYIHTGAPFVGPLAAIAFDFTSIVVLRKTTPPFCGVNGSSILGNV